MSQSRSSRIFFLWIKTRWQSLTCHWPKNVYPRKNTSIDWPWFLLHIKNVCRFLRCIQWCAFETIKIFKTTTAHKNWKYMMCALCNYLCICSSHSWQKMLLKIVILNGFISVLETRLVDLVRRQPIRGGLVSKTLPFPICLLTYASPIFYNTFFAFLAYYDMQCIHTKIGVSQLLW